MNFALDNADLVLGSKLETILAEHRLLKTSLRLLIVNISIVKPRLNENLDYLIT